MTLTSRASRLRAGRGRASGAELLIRPGRGRVTARELVRALAAEVGGRVGAVGALDHDAAAGRRDALQWAHLRHRRVLVLRVAVRLLRAGRRRRGWWSKARRGEDAKSDGVGVVLEDHTDLARGVDVKVIQTPLSTFCMENH